MEVKRKEEDMKRRQTSQPDDTAEIEVVLEASPDFDKMPPRVTEKKSTKKGETRAEKKNSNKGDSKVEKKSTKKGDSRSPGIPELATSSSLSTEEPVNPEAATRKFMEKQQQNASKNRRKSFRDRFMRSSKKDKTASGSNLSPSEKTSPRKGLSARGRAFSKSLPNLGVEKRQQERGRSRERLRNGRSSQEPIREETSNSSDKGSRGHDLDPLLDAGEREEMLDGGRPVYYHTPESNVKQPITIDVASQSRVSELSTPVAILRQESLGTVSIQGVRQALQKMETELAEADGAGKRVPRDRIMNALNFMATSLHRDEQKKALAKELDAWIDESVIGGGGNKGTRVDHTEEYSDEDSDDESSYSDDDSSAFDFGAYDDGTSTYQQRANISFQDLVDRLGKFFTISDADKNAVRTAVEDLFGTDLADARPATNCFKKDGDTSEHSGGDSLEDTMTFGDALTFDPMACNLEDAPKEPKASTRGRSWWRQNGVDGHTPPSGNQYPKVGRELSPESKFDLPSPTGNVNPRNTQKTKSNRFSGRSTKSSRSSRKQRAKEQKEPIVTARYSMNKAPRPSPDVREESGSLLASSVEDTDSWGLNDRYYTTPRPKIVTPRANRQPPNPQDYANQQYSASDQRQRQRDQSQYQRQYQQHPQFQPEYQHQHPHAKTGYGNFESDFLASPREEDEFEEWDDCPHQAENVVRPQPTRRYHPRQEV